MTPTPLVVRSAPTLAPPPADTGAPQGVVTRQLVDAQGQALQLRAAAESNDGSFDGYACVWDVVDAYGTRFRRGCFSAGGLDEAAYPLLWMHDRYQVLGVFYAREDDHGLHITGRWDDTPEGQSARAKAKSGSAPGLSVGFAPLGVAEDDPDEFTVARLVETSQIVARMAAVPGAALVGVRGQQPADQPPTDAPDAARDALLRAGAQLALAEPVGR